MGTKCCQPSATSSSLAWLGQLSLVSAKWLVSDLSLAELWSQQVLGPVGILFSITAYRMVSVMADLWCHASHLISRLVPRAHCYLAQMQPQAVQSMPRSILFSVQFSQFKDL